MDTEAVTDSVLVREESEPTHTEATHSVVGKETVVPASLFSGSLSTLQPNLFFVMFQAELGIASPHRTIETSTVNHTVVDGANQVCLCCYFFFVKVPSLVF